MEFSIRKIKKRPRPQEIAYMYYSVLDDACDVCKEIDGLTFLPLAHFIKKYRVPNPRCRNPRGCACIIVTVLKEEQGSEEIVHLLQEHQGVISRVQFEDYERKKERMQEQQAKSERKTAENFMLARKLEKTDINRSIELYQSVLENADLERMPSYILGVYIRLSLIYEKLHSFAESLEMIEKFFKINEERKKQWGRATKADIESMKRREKRIKSYVGRQAG